ncbi:hypothetical protein PRIPAC_79287 [Pristionchus pacificus]|uniref:Uncharacterized protein n=1 Tax=Pristionchus pacificus TaxID=54126 RepID=A0A2A6CMN5_PRIPA|nr:hypothetical protein PRIPAC_79287 [Pristionchus pacificus]|eukprot:PDM79366.1 hypothetical protein PRIPAC_31945 [Pristionchus pacificus]
MHVLYLNSYFFLSFVHRVIPSGITKIVLDGAVICSEVVIIPANADLPPLPAYIELNPSPHRSDRPPPPQLPSYASRPHRVVSQEPPQ